MKKKKKKKHRNRIWKDEYMPEDNKPETEKTKFEYSKPPKIVLTFSPMAWLKLKYFCHAGETEIGGFGVSAKDNLLYIEDFKTVKQTVGWASVSFDDVAVADYWESLFDRNIAMERGARIWCHTHPGESVDPSGTDEHTFKKCFGECDWAIMFILGRTDRTYARLRFRAGPGGSILIPTEVDWEAWPKLLLDSYAMADQFEEWQNEYEANIEKISYADLTFGRFLPIGGTSDRKIDSAVYSGVTRALSSLYPEEARDLERELADELEFERNYRGYHDVREYDIPAGAATPGTVNLSADT